MRASVLLVVAVLAVGAWAKQSQDDSPVTRVVKLLQTMQHELESDAKKDDENYDKMGCWCNKNKYEKKEAIKEANDKISQLTSEIEGLTARTGDLTTVIAKTEEELKANQDALESAKAMRAKEAEEFHAEDLDRTQAIANLKGAVRVMKKHFEFVEEDNSQFMQPATSFSSADEDSLQAVQPLVSAYLQKEGREGVASLVQMADPEYKPQSGQIFGILKQMLRQFEKEAEVTQKEEGDKSSAFGELRAEKEAEIDAGKKTLEEKEAELGTKGSRLVEAKEDLEETQDLLAEDTKFLANVEKQCAALDAEFEQRAKARQQEVAAVSEALQMLTSDDARDAFGGSFKFVQVRASTASSLAARAQASALLAAAAKKTGKWADFSALQFSLKLDAFEKVHKAIDDMEAALKQQQIDEVKKKDWCDKELQKTTIEIGEAEQHKKNTEQKIDDLSANIETLAREIKELTAQIEQITLEMARANEDRKSENAVFQQTNKDQKATIAVLTKVYDRLQQTYGAPALVQKAAQAPPVQFDDMKKNRNSGGVLAMIEALVVDGRNLLSESNKAEKESQTNYVQFIHDSQDSVAMMTEDIVNKKALKAEATEEKTAASSDLKFTTKELLRLADYEQQMHKDCDYVLKNFSIRQSARQEEIEALQSARGILKGAM